MLVFRYCALMSWKGLLWKPWVMATNFNTGLRIAVGLLCLQQVFSESLIQTVSGTLLAENITFYRLTGEGSLRLELHSLKGDADLYVSSQTLQPSFDNNELKSETCGLDVIEVPSTMDRPVGIGIYGHPLQPKAVYKMDIFFVAEGEVDEYEQLFKTFHYYDYYEESKGASDSQAKQGSKKKVPLETSDDSEDSVWWTILVTILKFVLEIIV
ncbi:hypothetical protein BaRGS_00003192 [Batillaria attramentaria]|uniref:Uncharacterized protein n=1 Tax=Batillaria attramentaria TaxID=370345 RepID=A0ABD0M1H0_9CAEN